MGFAAEMCPKCCRVTRCQVSQSGGAVWGVAFGIPFILPTASAVKCLCLECGQEFPGSPGVEDRTLQPEIALQLDADALLQLTNPRLRYAQVLSELRSDPQLSAAFALFDRVSPGSLRTGLESNLVRWPSLDQDERSDFLGRIDRCAEAEQFIHSISGQYKSGVTGYLLGATLAIGVWLSAWFLLESPGTLGWALVFVFGIGLASLPEYFISTSRDRKWVREVLLPEANRRGVSLSWVIAVLEETSAPRGEDDAMAALRNIGPAIRDEMHANLKDHDGGARIQEKSSFA